jgi:hypothetical protein
LYDSIENSVPGTQAAKAHALQDFLVSAEGRYMSYLALLDDVAKRLKWGHQQYSVDFTREMPLPPWYVSSTI